MGIYVYEVEKFKINFYLVVYNLDIFFYYFRLFFEVYFFGLNEIIVIIFYGYFWILLYFIFLGNGVC